MDRPRGISRGGRNIQRPPGNTNGNTSANGSAAPAAGGIGDNKRKLLSTADKANIIKLIDEGKSVEAVATNYGTTVNFVKYILDNRTAILNDNATGRSSSFKIKKKKPEEQTGNEAGPSSSPLESCVVPFRNNDVPSTSSYYKIPKTATSSFTIPKNTSSYNIPKKEDSVKRVTSGRSVTFKANFFPLTSRQRWVLFKHHVDFNPPEERKHVRFMLLKQHKDRFSGYQFDGSTLYTVVEACQKDQPLELVSETRDGNRYNVVIKLVGVSQPDDPQYMQVFNIILRNCLKSLGLQEIKRKFCDPKAQIDVSGFPLRLWPGYDTSIAQYEHNILLKSEIVFSVLRKDTAYDVWRRCATNRDGTDPRDAYKNLMLGANIITTYNNKNYRIDDVDYESNPLKTFEQNRRGETVTVSFVQYFKDRYDARIDDVRQPMLIVKANRRQKRAGMPETMNLVPELCTMTGLTDDMRSNFQLMKGVATYTRLDPCKRVDALRKFAARMNVPEIKEKLKSWNMELNTDLMDVPGHILEPENIVFGNDQRISAGPEADWTRGFRGNVRMINPIKLDHWVIIYPNRAESSVREFCKQLRFVGPPMGMEINDPRPYRIPDDRTTFYITAIEQAVNEANPKLILFVVPNNKSDRYGDIKRKCIVDRAVPSQIVVGRTIDGNKNLRSIATKIAVQLNCKLGGAPWSIPIPTQQLMVVGFDVTHDPRDKRKSYGAMVATLNKSCTNFFSCVSSHAAGEEISNSFGINIMKAVERFQRQNNGSLPQTIVVFRDGVGDGNVQYVKELEVNAMKSSLSKMYEANKQPFKMVFIIVTKKHNTRIFSMDRQNRESNPPPGSVVDSVITIPSRSEYYIISQSVRQGTVSPTLYNIIENTTTWPVDNIQKLTYKLTHLYFNWSGTVKVPAMCQYAHKLAFLTANHIRGAPNIRQDNVLYYL